ncbi:gliding motility-associated C-terminal domain-containing protein [Aurantibacillus circumpalustris]|uniref:T9SS type B sorting domain-containing protein n=1 Tax=Aurantibacillus circumpalustris TaxID=3036359 RepID=UPI00295BBD24|nr:gliding motility-associated C-terminal domain-containing protein [Aurantibacillus circumpalustris]
MRVLFLIFFSFLTVVSDAQIPTSGLVGAWPFNGNASDVSGSNNHGTVFGATLVPDRCGVPNAAYSFNGSTNYIQMLTTGPTGTLSRSVSFWAKTTNTIINSPKASFAYGSATGASDGFEIVWNYCARGVGLDLSNQALIKSNSCVADGQWHHIAIVYNATVSTIYSTVNFYVDGGLLPGIVCNVSGTNASINTGTVFPVIIGCNIQGIVRHFLGSLDDFYLYNRAITATEVMQLYTYTTCPSPVFGNTLVCPGSTNIYSVAPISNASYTWSLPGGWTGSSSTNTISVTAGSGSGTISATASSTCGIFPTATLAVNTLSLPLLGVSSTNSFLCTGGSATLTASGANTYTWLPGGSNNANLNISPMSTSVYTLIANALNSCSATVNYTQIVVNNANVVSFPPPSLCSGSTVSLSASGADTYTWQPGNLTGSIVTVAPLVTTSYTVIGFSVPGCTGSAIVQVSVPSALTLNIASSSPTACLGNSITFSASASGGIPGYQYNWVGGPSNPIKQVTPSVSGTYMYTVTALDQNTCSVTRTVSVNFAPAFTMTPTFIAICPATTTTLSVSGANTYTWLPGGTLGSTNAVSPTSLSVYTVIGTSIAGCTASVTKTVSIKPAPTLSFVTATITCGSLGSATVSASGTPGPFSYSWSPVTQTGSVAVGLYPGTHTIYVFDASTGCNFAPTTSFIPLIPLTGTVTATPSLTCFGINTGTAAITLSGGSGAQSYSWKDVNGIQTGSIGTNLAAGVNSITVIDALTFCTLTHTFLITQPTAFTLNIISSSPSVCMGGSITYTANNSGGTPSYSYNWINGPGNNIKLVNESLPGNYIYTVTSTDANNCSATNTIQANFIANPVVSVTSSSICPLANATLVASGASSYSWSSGSTLNPLVINPTVNTQYTVIGTASGCTSSATSDVFLKSIPVISYSTNAPVCESGLVSLACLSTHSLYSWSGPLSYSSSAAVVSLYSVTPAMNGNYTLRVTAANSCTASVGIPIIIYPTPPISPLSSTVCQGQILSLYGNYVPNATYLWLGSANYSSAIQNPQRINSDTSMTGHYTLQITSAQGCTNIATVNASVVSNPIPVITSSNSVCVGSNLVLNGSGGTSYIWFGPNGFGSYSQNPILSNVGLVAGGNYTLHAIIGQCNVSTTKYITVNPKPSFTISSDVPICEKTNLLLNSSISALSYSWSGPNGFVSNVSGPYIYSVSLMQSGVYSLNATDANGCEGVATIFISILPAPISIVKDASVCVGNSVTIGTSANGVSYLWSGPQNFTATGNPAYVPVVDNMHSGIYSVTVVGSNSCSITSTLNVVGFPFPLPIPLISGPTKVCMNSIMTLSGSGGTSYVWSGPERFNSISKDISIEVKGTNVAGIFTLSVRNESNCVASSTVSIAVYELPNGLVLSSKNNICQPFCAEFAFKELINTAPVLSHELYIDSKKIIDTSGKFCFIDAGNYTASVSYKDTNNCVNTSTLLITAYQKPKANFEAIPLNPIAGIDKVQFYNTSYGAGLNSWDWFVSGSDTLHSNEKEPNYLYEFPGKYPVVLIAKNRWECADTMIKVLVIEDDFNLFVPNAFTPNGDGLNDIFLPKGHGITKYSIEIYDSWGEKIFQSNNFSNGWNGTYKGKDCPTDIYIWKISVTTEQRETKTSTGHLTLLRGEKNLED